MTTDEPWQVETRRSLNFFAEWLVTTKIQAVQKLSGAVHVRKGTSMKSRHVPNQVVLVCKTIGFCSAMDETNFFAWTKKIKCVKRVQGVHDEIRLHVGSRRVPDRCLRELIALFFRYKVNMIQLQQFLSSANRHWFGDNEFWFHKLIFPRSFKMKR
jgi:hypothetical protein